jgi:hypothetical protein
MSKYIEVIQDGEFEYISLTLLLCVVSYMELT